MTDKDVLQSLGGQIRPVTASELAQALGTGTVTVAAALSRLEDEGLASPVGSSGFPRGGPGPKRWVRRWGG